MEAISNGMNLGLPSQISSASIDADPSMDKMKEMGEEFESVFLSMLLKEMRNSLEDGFFGGEGSDSFGGMFDMFIGKHLAESNAIGVGDLLVQQYAKGQQTAEDDASKEASGSDAESPAAANGISLSA